MQLNTRGEALLPVACTAYTCCDDVVCSDHRPVAASFAVTAHSIDASIEHSVKEEVLLQISRTENSRIPKVELRDRMMTFDKCAADEPSTLYMELVNTGATPAKWHFVSMIPGAAPMPRWITATPNRDVCMPGEVQRIAVSVTIPADDAQSAVVLKVCLSLLFFSLSYVICALTYRRTHTHTSLFLAIPVV